MVFGKISESGYYMELVEVMLFARNDKFYGKNYGTSSLEDTYYGILVELSHWNGIYNSKKSESNVRYKLQYPIEKMNQLYLYDIN